MTKYLVQNFSQGPFTVRLPEGKKQTLQRGQMEIVELDQDELERVKASTDINVTKRDEKADTPPETGDEDEALHDHIDREAGRPTVAERLAGAVDTVGPADARVGPSRPAKAKP